MFAPPMTGVPLSRGRRYLPVSVLSSVLLSTGIDRCRKWWSMHAHHGRQKWGSARGTRLRARVRIPKCCPSTNTLHDRPSVPSRPRADLMSEVDDDLFHAGRERFGDTFALGIHPPPHCALRSPIQGSPSQSRAGGEGGTLEEGPMLTSRGIMGAALMHLQGTARLWSPLHDQACPRCCCPLAGGLGTTLQGNEEKSLVLQNRPQHSPKTALTRYVAPGIVAIPVMQQPARRTIQYTSHYTLSTAAGLPTV